METISSLFHFAVSQPLSVALLFFYRVTPFHDYGVAVILLTLLTRLILYPLNTQSIKVQQKLSQLQPKLKEIQEKIRDKTEQARATLELYKKENVSPLSSLLPLLLQLPLMIGLYQLFAAPPPDSVSPLFLGILNLQAPHLPLAGAAAVVQFAQTKYAMPKKEPSSQQAIPGVFLYFFSGFTFLILSSLPSAMGLYWMSSSAFGILQQWIVTRNSND